MKAINIDPTKNEEEAQIVPHAGLFSDKNENYLSLMDELKEKERLLAEKEEEFKEEAYEEIKLSEDK